jgi:hypothetical protein
MIYVAIGKLLEEKLKTKRLNLILIWPRLERLKSQG